MHAARAAWAQELSLPTAMPVSGPPELVCPPGTSLQYVMPPAQGAVPPGPGGQCPPGTVPYYPAQSGLMPAPTAPAPAPAPSYAAPTFVPSAAPYALAPTGGDPFGYGAGPGTWQWQLLPDGLIYRSYLAGAKEPRFSGTFYHERDGNEFIGATIGSRVGVFRYGTLDPISPEGWQLDIEGAAFPRLNLDESWDLEATDFRIGIPLTYGLGAWQTKFAIYHISAHLGDEFVERTGAVRNNYSRNALVLGESLDVTESVRVYGEVGWAFDNDGGSEPFELQFGAEYSPRYPTGSTGSPFVALNGHLREEVDFGGNFVAQLGWQWRGTRNRHLLRTGLHYFNGKSDQYQFFDEHEEQIGIGLWYDY